MQLTFHGAAQTVTGSQHLLEINGKQLLLDCGMYQGSRQEAFQRNRGFSFDPRKIAAAILSHAHIDHSGNLPSLVKAGYSGSIYTTPATAELADIMLQDSGHIQEADAEFVNKRNERQGRPLVEPLYTREDAARVKQQLVSIPYRQPFEPIPGVTARLVDAGHILGSAAIVLDLEEKGRKTRLWFSGDIGRERLPLLQDPELPEGAETLLMECTYGDKPHNDPDRAFAEFTETVKRTIDRGGKVIVPAFAVGRTQELVYCLHQMVHRGLLRRVPVFVDSPLAVQASQIFINHPEYFDAETQKFIANNTHPALNFDGLTYVRSADESKALNERRDPMVIIAASGMAETGRILHHLRHNIENPRNTVVIVSWQAPNTLGRRLADRETSVRIFGEELERRAEVVTIGGLSAHAGQDLLLKYAQASRSTLKRVVLIHGETGPAGIFRQLLQDDGITPVLYPETGQSMEI